MIQFIESNQNLVVDTKTAVSGQALAVPPYKVYANIETIRGTKEIHLEIIDGFLTKPESLAFSHAEILTGGIFAVCLSIIENKDYFTYYKSEPMEIPPLAKSLLVKVFKNDQLKGVQHLDFENNLLPI